MTAEIPLTQGLVALVDDADYAAVVAAGKWHANPDKHTFYARRTFRRDGGRQMVPMHRFITGWPYVDHRNGDGLDNRRQNLRPADNSENSMNRGLAANNTSGFKGVSRHERRWQSRIRLDGLLIHLGTFGTPEDAARAYDEAALALFGQFARPNFPQSAA